MTKNGKIILISLSLLGFCGFLYFLYGGYKLFRGDLYDQSLEALAQNPDIQNQVGVPFEPSLLFSGNYFFSTMYMQYEIAGPNGNGWVVLVAEKTDAAWELSSLWVQVDNSEEYITVIEPEAYSFDAEAYEAEAADYSSGSCDAPDDYEGYAKEGEEPLPTEEVLVNGSDVDSSQ